MSSREPIGGEHHMNGKKVVDYDKAYQITNLQRHGILPPSRWYLWKHVGDVIELCHCQAHVYWILY